MKYVFFVTRDPWASFNSIYAYTKIKGDYPSKFLTFYTNDENMELVEKMLSRYYSEINKNMKMKKMKIDSESMIYYRKIIESEIESGDVIDITGARKIMILALSGLKGVRIVYLYLKDMRFSSLPFIMRPLSVQSFEEVEV